MTEYRTRDGLFPWFRTERRSKVFLEVLSLKLIRLAAIGSLFVLLDPVLTIPVPDSGGVMLSIGGKGFSDQIKGAVISLILVSGFAAVIAYWLGASSQGVKAQEVTNTIATRAAPDAAAAVLASKGDASAAVPVADNGVVSTGTMDVTATDVHVTKEEEKA